MGDADLSKSIQKTQELLGKYVKKPPLSEKNLTRPPFRFLHDIVTSVINTTGFLNGVFSPDQLDSANISSREAKSEFMQKLITAIKDATGEDVSAKISKILAGQEAEKTNELLQSLARAIEKSGGTNKGSKAAASKPKGKDTKIVANTKEKPVVAKKPDLKKDGPGKSTTLKSPSKPKPEAKAKKETTTSVKAASNDKPSRTGKTAAVVTEQSLSAELGDLGSTGAIPDVDEAPEIIPEQTIDDDSTAKSRKSAASASRTNTLKRQNSSIKMGTTEGQLDDIPERIASSSVKRESTSKDGRKTSTFGPPDIIEDDEHDAALYNDFINTSMKPNMETLTLPTSPIVPDALPGLGLLAESLDEVVDNSGDLSGFKSPLESKSSSSTNLPGPSGKINNEKSDAEDGFGSIPPIVDNATSSVQSSRNRPGTGSSRLTSARPPSARPAPPRPKSSMFRDTEESNFRPPTGKVTNVMLDSADNADDDDNFVIREADSSKGKGLSDLDETPELTLTAMIKSEDKVDDLLPEQRGLLVNQILETQKELEDKDKQNGQPEFSMNRSKTREVTTAEIEKLKSLIQDCARNANPLGKLLDYVREDMDAMQKELSKWREESRHLDTELEKAKEATETSLQPLQQQLLEIETRIADKEDGIAATKMAILRHQERISKILSGLDRVQSSHGKITIPSASQLMQSDPIMTNSTSFEEKDSSDNSPYNSGFGSALNRLSRSSISMRPVNFLASTDNLDPDEFDPWKS